ncbi:unnamed protein product [Rhizoctonia solani]|uniref:F-box domain-containing protein n=1 Tax=Rhizoctonia solani TaxID=456999 RepID=A0A8H3BZX0_9AGAM|nr:unnamed protein product [Rhizoctonia solani]
MHIQACSLDADTKPGELCSDHSITDANAVASVDHKPQLNFYRHGINQSQDEQNIIPVPPINALPTELLILIFKFAHYLWWKTFFKKERADWPALWDKSIRKQMRSGYPEVLTHVCYFWRQVVFSSPTLWSYIDLFTLGQPPQFTLDRSSAFIARAQSHELTLRVRLRHGTHEPVSECTLINDFCSSIGPRLNSLRIDNNSPSDSITLFSSVIQATLPHTTPGILTKLDIKDHSVRTISNYSGNSDGLAGWLLPAPESFGVSQHLLDDIIHPIKILRLSGQFFPWTSPAYRGLVELHLQCTRPHYGHRPSVQVDQLREILLACPELRIFHINININEQSLPTALSPVPLPELEELNLRGLKRSLYDLLLPLLSPGQKPLQITFQTQRVIPSILYCSTLLSFFRRTNVTSLYIVNRLTSCQHLSLDLLLTESPINLHTLGLERFHIAGLEPSRLYYIRTLAPMQLNRLYLRKCIIDMDAVKNMAEIFPAQILKLHEPEFQCEPNNEVTQVREKICSMFPIVKWVRSTRGMELWDAWEMQYFD